MARNHPSVVVRGHNLQPHTLLPNPTRRTRRPLPAALANSTLLLLHTRWSSRWDELISKEGQGVGKTRLWDLVTLAQPPIKPELNPHSAVHTLALKCLYRRAPTGEGVLEEVPLAVHHHRRGPSHQERELEALDGEWMSERVCQWEYEGCVNDSQKWGASP